MSDIRLAPGASGEDAIAFFAKNNGRQRNSEKFVYCNRSASVENGEDDPYSLIVVDEADINPFEYFTISASGLVHIKENTPSERHALSEWMHQSLLYSMLRSISFFKNFLVARQFNSWKVNVQYRKFSKQREELRDQLVLMKPVFVNPIIDIFGRMRDESNLKLLTFRSDASALNTFIDMLSGQRGATLKTLKVAQDQIEAILDTVVQNVRAATHLPPPDVAFGKTAQKAIPMWKAREEAEERAAQLQRAAQDEASLGDLIRLADYICSSTTVHILVQGAMAMARQAEAVSSSLINTSLRVTSEIHANDRKQDLIIDPSKEIVEHEVDEFWLSTISLATSTVPPFSDSRQFRGLTAVVSSNSRSHHHAAAMAASDSNGGGLCLSVDAQIQRHGDFRRARKSVNDSFRKGFDVALNSFRSNNHMQITSAVDFNRSWNRDSILQETSFDILNQTLITTETIHTRLESILNTLTKSPVTVETRPLKNDLTPCMTEAKDACKDRMLQLTRSRANRFLADLDGHLQILAQRPQDLIGFAAFVKRASEIGQVLHDVEAEKEIVLNQFVVLTAVKAKLISDDTGLHRKVIDRTKTLNDALSSAVQYFTEKKSTQTTDVVERSQEIEESSTALRQHLMGFNTIESAANINMVESIVQELRDIGKSLENNEKTAEQFISFNSLFSSPIVPSSQKERNERDLFKRNEDVSFFGNKKTVNEFDDVFEFRETSDARKLFDIKSKLWEGLLDFMKETDSWIIDSNIIEFFRERKDVSQMQAKVQSCVKEAFQLDKKLAEIYDGVNDPIALKYRALADEWRIKMPVLIELANPAMQQRHWENLCKELRISSSNITLHRLEEANIYSRKDLVSEISGCATGQKQVEDDISKVEAYWENELLPVIPHGNKPNSFILGDISEIVTKIEDHTVVVQTCLGSRFVADIRDNVEKWYKRLTLATDTLDEFSQVQRSWMYLENIFSADDIKKFLPVESTKFSKIDQQWKDTLRRIRQTHNKVMDAIQMDRLLEKLQDANKGLEDVQRRMEDYLETKRAGFPRFFFLSNDELLSILSDTKNANAVQPHLGKCFDGIKSIDFQGPNSVVAMCSAEGEVVPFLNPVLASGPVETWLSKLEQAMRSTLRAETKRGWQEYPEDGRKRQNWLFNYPAQCVLTVDMIFWTLEVEKALVRANGGDKKALENCEEFLKEQLKGSVSLVRTQLTPLQRTMMGALIVLDVHNRDVVTAMKREGCSSLEEFAWTKQLRYYWDADPNVDNTVCKQTNTRFEYAWEYLGNTERLVITPLTDKCYMTLTGALSLNYGGAPAGPAGTGKTETTKDLGKALAVKVVVFNCSDGLDNTMMSRFFSGLAQSGSWACFDEFNRIDREVLSVIAQQMMTVVMALKAKKERFVFEGVEIPLNHGFGVFITMNPGYAGRSELPDNLKALFRPVAMMVPDYGLIAEIILFSEGFDSASLLARKMVNLYKLSSEQLSKQDHYDFGMRAVKSVLVMAGKLKRKYPDTDENLVLIRAMRDSNIPKFLSHDLPLFLGIIDDLFPGVEVPYLDYGDVQKAVSAELRERNLQTPEGFVTKIIQLLETQNVRHGVMVVGTAATGKSTVVKTLQRAMTRLARNGSSDPSHQETIVHSLNPKAVLMRDLYGYTNEMTGQWSEGLIGRIVRDAVAETRPIKQWVNFDGPVDALWIENMNTVLDDNKILCLPNSERIKLPPSLTMMFEVNDLKVASPATVSRCGMVYLEPHHLGWEALINTWAEKFEIYKKNSLFAKQLKTWSIEICQKAIPFIRTQCKEVIASVDANLVTSLCKLLTSFFWEENLGHVQILPDETSANKDDNAASGVSAAKKPREALRLASMHWAYCVVWALGCNLHDESRDKFSKFIRPLLREKVPDYPNKDDLDVFSQIVDVPFQEDEHGRKTAHVARASFRHIDSVVPEFIYDRDESFFNILVPTQESVAQHRLLFTLTRSNFHVLVSGNSGVGKSVGVNRFLLDACKGDDSSFVSVNINFSAQTSTHNLENALTAKLTRGKKNLGPAPGKVALVFIDDANMPVLEEYGAQPPIELLRQIVDTKRFYDTVNPNTKLVRKDVADTLFLLACAPPGGGRNAVTPRLLRHFSMLWTPDISVNSMSKIFQEILGNWLVHNAGHLSELAKPIVSATVEMYQRITTDLLPTPTKSHYTFNLRDPAKLIQGMLMIFRESLKKPMDVINLWAHEACRQFKDRLVDAKDRKWFNKNLISISKNVFDGKCPEFGGPADLSESGDVIPPGLIDDAWLNNLMFGEMFDISEKTYTSVMHKTAEQLEARFDEALEEYNMSFPSQMNLVFFRDAQLHLARILRVLRQDRGNLLLIGVGGSGRQSLTRLAAFVREYSCSSIEISKNYSQSSFKEDLKRFMEDLVKNNKPNVFIFSDTQIVEEVFLEDVNNILNTGEVPNLFAPDETERVISATRPIALQRKVPDGRDTIWSFFIQLVREQFHIALAFSPVGNNFRSRCRQFPSLVNCCTIDWFDVWPAEALYSVAKRFYSEKAKDLEFDEHTEQLCELSALIHNSVSNAADSFLAELRRKTYTTPTSYLELIKLYIDMLSKQRESITSRVNVYLKGIKTLEETNKSVAEMKLELARQQPILDLKSKETEELIIKLEADKKAAAIKAQECEVTEKAAEKARGAAAVIESECQSRVEEAQPIVEESLAALQTVSKKDTDTTKSYVKPPPAVEFALAAVMIMLQKKQDWATSKQFLGTNVLQTLMEYDKDNIPPKIVKTAKAHMANPEFPAAKVKGASEAAYALYKWVDAMIKFDEIMKEVVPLRSQLATAQEASSQATEQLNKAKTENQAIQEQLTYLQQTFERKQKESEQLKRDIADTEARLRRAVKLVDGLKDEAIRWAESSETLTAALGNLTGDILISAGMIAYVGPFTAKYRKELSDLWWNACQKSSLRVSPQFSLPVVLSDAAEIREWNVQGLPADQLSTENGIFVTRGRRWPLMIDPQSQANTWLKKRGGKSGAPKAGGGFTITKFSDPKVTQLIQSAIPLGNTILLENVGEVLDPVIEPILVKAVYKSNGQQVVKFADKETPWNDSFRFYLTTKLANPHFLPEVCIKVTIINFTVTPVGLEDQLLIVIVNNERQELEEERNNLVVSIANDTQLLLNLERQILKAIDAPVDQMLADDVLINTLDDSKKTSNDINIRKRDAEVTAAQINDVRNQYRSAALRGSLLYFVVAELAAVDMMYAYSLEFFVSLIKKRLKSTKACENVEERLEILIEDFTHSTFENVCRGIFERHKLLFAFLICCSVSRNSGSIHEDEFNAFLRIRDEGSQLRSKEMEENGGSPVEGPSGIDSVTWACSRKLADLVPSYFSSLVDLITAMPEKFIAFHEAESIDYSILPSSLFVEGFNSFHKLLLVRILRGEDTLIAIRDVVGEFLGPFYTEAPALDLSATFNDSDNVTPLIFILSPGADPMQYLRKLADERGFSDKLRPISLGKGQDKIAKEQIKNGTETGEWVCLQNCHLARSFMPQLEEILDMMEPESIHSDFRLWLTSMPDEKFPVPILQASVKITNEPPKGLKANLRRSFLDLNERDFEECSQPVAHKRMLFALCFFHAVILERRKFGPIGWNIPYEWMGSDLEVSQRQLKVYIDETCMQYEGNLEQASPVDLTPFRTLNYIVADINYGGRVTDDKDVRLISALLQRYFNKSVFDESFKFAENAAYKAPNLDCSLSDVRVFIESLPLDEDPEVFGLHPNAALSSQAREVKEFIDIVQSVQPRKSGAAGGGKSTDQLVDEKASQILSVLPQKLNIKEAHAHTVVYLPDGSQTSLSVFFQQETTRFNALISKVSSSLSSLKDAIAGLVVMSAELEDVYNCFLIEKVPLMWSNAAYPCLKPLTAWVQDLCGRLAFMKGWLLDGPPPSFLMPAFFFPQGFATAALQAYARATHVPIDSLNFCSYVRPEQSPDELVGVEWHGSPDERAIKGVCVHGLHLQGCGWSSSEKQLCESKRGIVFMPMPLIHLEPSKIDPATNDVQIKVDPGMQLYKCPVYKVSTRAGTLSTTGHSTNFVFNLSLPTSLSPDLWIRRGVAILCLLDY